MNVFITGTDTGVGKTFITAGITASLIQQGAKVAVYKPAQTGAKTAEDIDYIKRIAPSVATKCSYVLEPAAAPTVAADVMGVEISKDTIKKDFNELKNLADITIMEGAGGLMVPFGKDFTICDVAKMLKLPTIIVAKADLGTINHTLLTVEMARKNGLKVLGVIINNYPQDTKDIAIKTAPMIIQKFGDVEILGIVPRNQNPFENAVVELVSENVNISSILQ